MREGIAVAVAEHLIGEDAFQVGLRGKHGVACVVEREVDAQVYLQPTDGREVLPDVELVGVVLVLRVGRLVVIGEGAVEVIDVAPATERQTVVGEKLRRVEQVFNLLAVVQCGQALPCLGGLSLCHRAVQLPVKYLFVRIDDRDDARYAVGRRCHDVPSVIVRVERLPCGLQELAGIHVIHVI